MLKAFRYRLCPTKGQADTLEWTLRRCRELYNAALEERRTAYRKCGVSVGKYEQMRALPEIKSVRPEYADVHSQVLQDVIKRLDKAFQGFFARVKTGQTPGFPRFQGAHRYDSFCYPQYRANVADDATHVYLPKIGNVRIRLSRPLEGQIKTATVKRDVDQWYIVFVCEVAPVPLPATGSEIGIDLGLNHFLITSDGEFVDAPQHFRKAQRKLRRAQRSLARKKRGGKNRAKQRERVAKLHRKVRRQRLDFHHKTAKRLVDKNDTIAHEALNVKGLGRTRLAKSVQDAGWRQFLMVLSGKAEYAGRSVVAVDPKYTSQTCPNCGNVAKKSLAQRWHSCQCGYEAHRDVAAAQVIKGRADPLWRNVGVVEPSVPQESHVF